MAALNQLNYFTEDSHPFFSKGVYCSICGRARGHKSHANHVVVAPAAPAAKTAWQREFEKIAAAKAKAAAVPVEKLVGNPAVKTETLTADQLETLKGVLNGTIRHRFIGNCPDRNQPKARDSECKACNLLDAAMGVKPKAGTAATVAKPAVKEADPEILLPANTRYYRKHGHDLKILVEVKPMVVKANFKLYYESEYDPKTGRRTPPSKTEFEVALPWQYFWIDFKDNDSYYTGRVWSMQHPHLFWAQNRLKTIDDPAYPARLPNTPQHMGDVYAGSSRDYGLGYVCLGNQHGKIVEKSDSPSEMAERLVTGFYDGTFTQYLGKEKVPFGTPEEWEKETKKNPFCWMDWPMKGIEVKPLSKFIGKE